MKSDEKIQAVIFDLDGVLCSTDEFHYLAWKQLADELGIPFDKTVNMRLRGVSRGESLEILLERANKAYTAEEKAEFCERKNNYYKAYLQNLTAADLEQGAIATLTALKQKGIRIAVGSSSKNTKFILARLGIFDLFDAIADGTDVARSKPFPDVFLKAAQRLSLAPASCLVVEDAVSGIEAGEAGGFQTAAFGDIAKRKLADHNLTALCDLLELT